MGKLDQHGPCQNEAQFFFLALRQTTPNDIPLLFYASIQHSMYQMSQKCKIEMSLDVTNCFFLNWLFSWGFDKKKIHKIGKKSETKIFTVQKTFTV